jgi:outer membrane protein
VIIRRELFWLLLVCVVCAAARAAAQTPSPASTPARLTLEEARQMALKNHARIGVAVNTAAAANEVTTQVRSRYFPNVYGSLTGVEAQPGSRIAAGGLNNPIIYNRFSAGLTVQQLVTDFGRTQNLVSSARFQAQAAQADVNFSRADVLLDVDRAYFGVLRAQAILRVAADTVKNRGLVVEQISALEKSKLKSGLDLSFANVNLEQARLLLLKAQNDVQASAAALSEALGFADQTEYELVEPAEPPTVASLAEALAAASRDRPELAALRFQVQGARRLATAERDLWFPSIALTGAAGAIPYRQSPLPDNYAAAGFNVNIPIFNGRDFDARRREAEDRARAESEVLRGAEARVARDVRFAWLSASTAYQNLSLTAQLFEEANKALDLAQARYNLGLGSIVELSQAQLQQVQAGIEQASAKYDYQTKFAELLYQEGALR